MKQVVGPLVLIGAVVAVAIFAIASPDRFTSKPLPAVEDRISSGCQREFGYFGQRAVADCQSTLTTIKTQQDYLERLDRAAR